MKQFTEVNKVLAENVKVINHVHYKSWNNRVNYFNSYRKKFCESLQKDGYQTYTVGNYITAKRDNETNTFFFSAHAPEHKNYLIPANLGNRVQYFAFYDEITNCVYNVAYNKVREYCKDLNSAVVFGNSEAKLLVPDDWAKQQILNTYHM